MNLPQAKTLLEKIITLYKTLSVDEKNISAIERDLMLSYVRQLYETFLDTPQNLASATSAHHRAAQAEHLAVPKPEVPKQPPPPPPPPPVQPKPLFNQPRPVVEQQPEYVVETPREPVVQPPPPPSPPPAPLPPPSAPIERPKPVSYDVGIPSDIEALFDDNSSRELSDRLSNTPIPDLAKAFGLNDRLLAQNELFGGSKMVFDEAIKDLNNMSSFDTAKSVIVTLAVRYNWTANQDRKKQAKSLIKLVRRRFK